MTEGTKPVFDDRFGREMTEAAEGMRKLGVMNDAAFKVTMREINRDAIEETVVPLTGSEIKELRERAKMSQAALAHYLRLTVDHVSNLERGAKHPTGPALVLLNVIRRKGIEVIL